METVINIQEFKTKYGEQGIGFVLLIQEFIHRSPDFKGGIELAKAIGTAIADFQNALKNG